MLIISLFTDIAPSLSLMMEKPERNLLLLPPRSKKEHLVDWKFILQAYVFLGGMIVFFSQCMYFWYMQWYAKLYSSDIILSFGSWSNGYKNMTMIQINEYFYTGQTVTFISIVYLQIFGNLLSTRTNVKSFFNHATWEKRTRNLWILVAQIISLLIMLFIVMTHFCNDLFNTRTPSAQFFILPLAFCFIVFFADEIRKLLVRKKVLCFPKIGW